MARRALLVGINRYKIPGADLRGCLNDVKNLKSVLTRYYGFADKDIRTLTDLQATKKAMQSAITKLIGKARAGDVLLFHYSGHGANVPDRSGDEADARDEILCPTDLDWKDPLLDDWLRAEFDKLPAGVNFTVIMDCCHSGTNTRAVQPPDAKRIERYLPCPLDLLATESGRRLRGAVRGSRVELRGAGRRGDIVNVNMPELLITGCRSTQTSADAYIGNSYNGALTYNLVAAIQARKGKLTYKELHAATLLALKKGRFEQVPQLEGRSSSFDLPFLSPIAQVAPPRALAAAMGTP
jgi:metacaspase-1